MGRGTKITDASPALWPKKPVSKLNSVLRTLPLAGCSFKQKIRKGGYYICFSHPRTLCCLGNKFDTTASTISIFTDRSD